MKADTDRSHIIEHVLQMWDEVSRNYLRECDVRRVNDNKSICNRCLCFLMETTPDMNYEIAFLHDDELLGDERLTDERRPKPREQSGSSETKDCGQ